MAKSFLYCYDPVLNNLTKFATIKLREYLYGDCVLHSFTVSDNSENTRSKNPDITSNLHLIQQQNVPVMTELVRKQKIYFEYYLISSVQLIWLLGVFTH